MRFAKLVLSTCAGMALACNAIAASDEAPRVSLRMSSELTSSLASAAPSAVAPNAPAAKPAITKPVVQGTKDYRIGPEDLIEIQVFGVDQLTRTVRVNSRGNISLPLIGNVQVGGLTGSEAEAVIVSKLSESYLQDPQVSLFIKEYTNQRVTVEGAVQKPGIYPLRGQTTLLRAIAVAGGQGSLSDLSNIVIYRADSTGLRTGMTYDIEKIRRGEQDDPTVLNDDVVVVNRSPARVVLKDSIFRDALDAINPFSYIPK